MLRQIIENNAGTNNVDRPDEVDTIKNNIDNNNKEVGNEKNNGNTNNNNTDQDNGGIGASNN